MSTLDRELIEQRIDAMWSLRQRGDIAALGALLAADCVYVGKTFFTNPVDIRREGRDACLDWARHMSAMIHVLDVNILELVIDGEEAVACLRLKMREQGGSHTEDILVCSYMRFRDGEIVEIKEYPDTIAVKRLLGA